MLPEFLTLLSKHLAVWPWAPRWNSGHQLSPTKHGDWSWSHIWEPSPKDSWRHPRRFESINAIMVPVSFFYLRAISNIEPLKGSSVRFPEGKTSKYKRSKERAGPLPDPGLGLMIIQPMADVSWHGFHSDTVSSCFNCYIFWSMLLRYCFN